MPFARILLSSPRVAGLALGASLPLLTLAQTAIPQPKALKETVVTATRSATRTDELVSDVVVVEREQIERSAGRTLPELLAREAGLQFSSNGGLGGTSNVYIRGTEARHTILLIDGVRYGSVSVGTPIWDNLPLDMIERIEVLKGPASSLYGSEGVGGVVQIFTRKGRTGFHPEAAVSLGSQGNRRASASLAAGADKLSYNVSAQNLRQTGISATNARAPFGNFNPDTDGFTQSSLNASFALQLHADWSLDGGLVYSDGISQFDDGPGRDSRSTVRSVVARAGLSGRPMAHWQTRVLAAQSSDTNNAIVSAFSPSNFVSTQGQLSWQNTLDTAAGTVLAGVEQLQQRVSSSTAFTVNARTVNSVFAGLNGSSGPHSWQFNLRSDNNSQFSSSGTGFAGYGFRISPNWRVNASYGTSFVAPSFNQLYFPGFGNPLLQPEKGKNTDLGLTYSSGATSVKLVRYDNRITGFIPSGPLPANVPKARISGTSLEVQSGLGAVALRGTLDALNPRNELTGKLLPRRTRMQYTLGADYDVGLWQLGASLLHSDARFDDVANLSQLAGFTTIDLFLSRKLSTDWSLQGRVNNLTNAQYETVLGYNQPTRGVYVTLRYQPK